MSQINSATLLSEAQINAAIQFNKNLNLSSTSIKILQNHISESISGVMDRQTVSDLINQDYQEVYLRTLLEKKLKQMGIAAIPDTWEGVVSFISDVANFSITKDIHNQLGKLHEGALWGVIQDMASVQSQNFALMLAADYFKLPLVEKTFCFRYDPKLAYPYATHIPFTDIVVSPVVDNQRVNGVFNVPKAPTDKLDIQIGKPAFKSLEDLKATLNKALQVKVNQVSVSPSPSGLSSDDKKKRLEKSKIQVTSETAIRMIQGLGGVPMTGIWDENTIDGIANFQKKRGLTSDGDLGPTSLKHMVAALKEMKLFEAAVQLVIGYNGMWDEDIAGVFYFPDSPNDGAQVDQGMPGIKWVEFGHLVFSQTPDDLAKSLIKGLSPLIEYKGKQFTGENSALIDIDFLPAIRRVNEYARMAGVLVFVSGPRDASFRKEGTTVSGAIVKPATNSNHKIGHAIDMNLIVDGKHYNSTALKDHPNWPPQIKKFIEFIRNDEELRWGGDFSKPDPVHIDDAINLKNKTRFAQRYYATQKAVGLQPGLRDASRGFGDETACDN